jgi:hypothetical protein
MAVKSALPTPTMMIDKGRVDALIIACNRTKPKL